MNMAQAVSRYTHSLRHLQPVQIYGRLWRAAYRPWIDGSPAPLERRPATSWRIGVERPASLVAANVFELLGERHPLPISGNWDDLQAAKLWRYNLHYFDDLNAAHAPARGSWHAALLRRWVAENAPGRGTGWEPYPVSLRMVNWIKWRLQGNHLPEGCLQSLAVQTRWLARHVEHHLQGNHLLANAKALLFAGLFFDGGEARSWLTKGTKLLARQLPEQILADGGHVERSPMYQGILIEDVLDLVQLGQVFPGVFAVPLLAMCRSTAAAMLAWQAVMAHPDGEISFFNDAAMGIAATPSALAHYGESLGIRASLPAAVPTGSGGVWLADSGYLRFHTERMVALLDMAPLGPDHLTGHGHADSLSFELSVDGARFIVNGGTSCYGTSAQRAAERGTAAHNTVEIDDQDSSEVWSGFRTARRARVIAPVRVSLEPPLAAAAAHDGYCRLSGRPIHRRTWRLAPDRLEIEDTISGRYRLAVGRFHMHPDVRIEVAAEAPQYRMLLPSGGRMTVETSGAKPAIVSSEWHPRFGASLPSACLGVWKEISSPAAMKTVFALEPAGS